MNKFEFLIIGGGPAAITICKNFAGKKKIAVIRPEDHSMIYCAMPYVIEGILEFKKTLKKDELVTDTGATLIRDFVMNVDFDNKIVFTKAEEEYQYENLIIASGAEAILPHIEGIRLDGVMTMKTEEDLREIIKRVEGGVRQAVVVGAGAIGIELAQALNAAGLETHLVDIFDTILPNMMDPDMIIPVQEKLGNTGIKLHLDERVARLLGDSYVTGVEFDNGKRVELEPKSLVVFAVGMKPSVDFLRESALAIGKTGIIVDEYMRTNIEGVYAVGDCCEFTSAISGEVALGKLATNAVPMARLLAKNILGQNRQYDGFYNGAATKVSDYFVGSTGLTERAAKERGFDYVVGKAKMTTAFPIMPFAKEIEIKLLVDSTSEMIIGGQIVSGEPATDKVDQITMAMQYDIPIRRMAQMSYSSQPYQSFFPANNLLVQAAENIISKLDQ